MEDKINEIISKEKAVIFSKSHCPYCVKAKSAFAACSVSPKVIELDEMSTSDMMNYQDALGKLTGARSVPRVFVGGKFIGGGDDTAALAASGALKKLCQSVGLGL